MYYRFVSDMVLVDPLVEDLFTHDDHIWLDFWSVTLYKILFLRNVILFTKEDHDIFIQITKNVFHLFIN